MPINVHPVSTSDVGTSVLRQINPGIVAIWKQVDGISSAIETKAYLVSASANVASAQIIIRAIPKSGAKVQILMLIDQFVADGEAITAEVAVWQRGGGFTAGPDECETPTPANNS